MMSRHMHKLAPHVEPIVGKAGDIALQYFRSTALQWHHKSEYELVSKADIEIEQFLINALYNVMPEANFLTEESGAQGKSNQELTWVIDPLDGTTNFVYGIPYFAISVALTQNNRPIFGMIYAPFFNELFYAQEGYGAFLNGQKIQVCKGEHSLVKSLLLVGFSYNKRPKLAQELHELEIMSKRGFSFRHLGAIALDQVYVACGRADAVFFEDLTWWDVAAGIIILQEAGAVVTTYENEQVGPEYRSYIAAYPALHDQLLPLLQKK